ncbi:MAG: hypothetical protein AAF917_10675, partial [Pseudomonadota bacterium]
VDAERARLEKQLDKVRADEAKSEAKLNNENFVNNAPAHVVETERQRIADFARQIDLLAEQLEKLAELG